MLARKKYTKEFKLDALSLVLEQGYGCTEAAKSLGIHQALLSRWLKEHQEPDGQAFRGNGKLTAEQLEIRRLQEQNKRLKMEKEILKKAAVFCSRNEIKYTFVAQNKKTWPVGLMCQLLGITRHGYYSYQQRQRNKPDDPEHEEVIEWVKKIPVLLWKPQDEECFKCIRLSSRPKTSSKFKKPKFLFDIERNIR